GRGASEFVVFVGEAQPPGTLQEAGPDDPGTLGGHSQLLPPLDHQRGHRVAPLEAATGPLPGAGLPQLRLLPRHRLLDRRRPRTGLKPPRSTAIRILNSTRNSEAPFSFTRSGLVAPNYNRPLGLVEESRPNPCEYFQEHWSTDPTFRF